ncbi:hypothetical protein BDN71DRAFT_1432400 [Pleurotus eryngii]|uniref:Ubiquitin-like protease family profile domain-containing protein n=1 Tax=Pleurotus eryngii TaxID=5323 RepID=A0A9P5ZS67_PLEER|nr:hypothetical protein BDN71DRAFT_1432400 [Pleurotus eryngii]
MPDHIDLTIEPKLVDFNSWIGVGREYSQLLTTQLLPSAVSLVLNNPKSMFSAETPNTPLAYLISPGCQAMLDRYVLIRYWNLPDVYVSFKALGLWHKLINLAEAQNTVLSVDELLEMPELSTIGNFVANSQWDVLIATLAYWPNHHWGFILIKISGGHVQVNWGDRLQLKIPSLLKEGVKLWSRRYMLKHILTINSHYPCALQDDSYSCGIIAVNALQHYTLGIPLWTGATREQLRVGKFFSCMEFCKDEQTADALLIPLFLPLATAISPVPPPVMPSQSMKHQRGNSNMISSPVSTPVSPPRPTIKCPRRGSRLNLNIAVVSIFAKGSILPEDDSSVASLDDEVNLVPFNGKKDSKSSSMILKECKNAVADKGSFVVNQKRWDTYIGKL